MGEQSGDLNENGTHRFISLNIQTRIPIFNIGYNITI